MSFTAKFFGDYYHYMQNALDGLSLQQKAIADNISNADNPNYHPKEVSFQDQLANILAADDNQDLQVNLSFDPEFQQGASPASFNPQITSGQTAHVDLNHEMSQLAKTQMLYNLASGAIKPGWTKFVIETLIR